MRRALLLALCLTAACEGSPATTPPGDFDAGSGSCTADSDCDDSLFCTGVERCVPAASGADARGCLSLARPCMPTQACLEEEERCETLCAVLDDADGDGARAIACGGDDCDDADPRRYPGAPEVCDDLDLDEDCDPRTYGARDADGDGVDASSCCNGTTCGADCDDARPNVHPSAAEVCNERDDDCDGGIDEEVRATFYRDFDGDLYGRDDETIEDCSRPAGYAINGGDCDDTRPNVHPGLVEICDGLDNDCDGRPNAGGEDDDEDGFVSLACGGTDCDDTRASVRPGATETCDGYDTDCNGALDAPGEDADGDGAPSCGPGPLDCIDTEARTGVCAAPLGCRSPVCACALTLPHTWFGVDLDTGRVIGTSAVGDTSGIDLGTDTGAGLGSIRVYNGARHQVAGGHTWWSVPSGGTMLGSRGDAFPMLPGEIYLVESNRGFLYKVGYVTSAPGGVRFFYAPVLDSPVSFACPP